jgi:hypothetical protein
MTFRLSTGAPDSWNQVYNPDRYTGPEYVSSFDLKLQVNSDGSLTATAQYPGRYKIAAMLGGQQYTAAVLVQPASAPVQMKGLNFLFGLNFNQTYAANAIAIASHTGANWAWLEVNECMDLNTPGVYQYTTDPVGSCTNGTPFPNVGWVIDQLHSNGFHVVIIPAIYANYQGVTDELEDFLPGNLGTDPKIDPSQVMNVFAAWGQMALAMATLSAQHGVEVFAPGYHDLSSVGFDDATYSALSAAWVPLLQNIRSVFHGQVWWGPVQPCGVEFPPTDFSLVDGIWFSGLIASASTPPCTFLSPPGIANIHAEQMLSYLRALRSAGAGFAFGPSQGLPMAWMDFYLEPIDEMNYLGGHFGGPGVGGVGSYPGSNPNLTRDFQENVDYLDAVMQAGIIEGGFHSAFPGSVNLQGSGFDDLLELPAALVSISNWYGGDWNYFAPCMSSPAAGVLFPVVPLSCPSALLGFNLVLDVSLHLVSDPTSPVTPYFQGSSEGKIEFGDFSWTDYDAQVQVRLATNTSLFGLGFRYTETPFYQYAVLIGQGVAQLQKTTPGANGPTNTVLVTQPLPGTFDPTHWYQVELIAMGNQFSVTVDGNQLIQYADNSTPILAGAFSFHSIGCCGESDFGNILVRSLMAPPPSQPSISFSTIPAALEVDIDSNRYLAYPETLQWTLGGTHTLSVPTPQQYGGVTYNFAGWSDGLPNSHSLSTPSNSTTFTATFGTCDVNRDGATNVADAQRMINEALGVTSPADDLNNDNAVNVVDVQIVVNAVLGLGCGVS